ncbi:MAG TPA: ASCH domain-containing protein [Flavobacteriaceae bacterium]|nr:ASCH domain-containing protein [Flavobacteriaceae bacterium]
MHILLSIHTKYVKKILDGTKKYEFRGWKLPDKVKFVYIYSSGIEKKIVARFEILKIHNDTPKNIWNKFKDKSGVSEEEYSNYVNSLNYGRIYAIEIENLQVFQRFLSLDEVDEEIFAPQKFKYLHNSQVEAIKRLSAQ